MRRAAPVFVTGLALVAACASPAPVARAPLVVTKVETATIAATSTASELVARDTEDAFHALLTTTTTTVAMTTSATVAASDDERDDDSGEVLEEEVDSGVDPRLRYTCDLSDDDLTARWVKTPEALGSISLGFAHEGRLINAEQFPLGEETGAWTVVMPNRAWATAETIEYVVAAAREVHRLRPDAPPLRVNGISLKEGGWFRPHRSHQNGRDVDLGFYYATAEVPRCRACEKVMDVGANWDLVKALVTLTDVQVILVDRAVQRALRAHALSVGEDPVWLASLFDGGRNSLIRHARRHRDHFHVRFYNPRAQELGRRVAPLLAQRPDQNLRIYRVRNGDNLGKIALRNKSSIRAIQKANHMRGTFLRIGQVLRVPMRGPCTRCPVPPPVEVPERRRPPPSPAELADVPADGSGTTGTSTTAALDEG